MNKLLSIYLPFCIFLTIAANAVLIRFGINYLYAILILVGTGSMLATGIARREAAHKIVPLFYILLTAIMAGVHGIMLGGELKVLSVVLVYIFVPLYWSLYFCKYGFNRFEEFLRLSVPIVYLVGFLGIVQFFFSPTIFGLIEVDSNAMKWASDTTYEEYRNFFRATSTLGSPQVYGLFMALCIVLIHSRRSAKSIFFWTGLVFLVFAGGLSGNKSFVAVLALYCAWIMLTSKGQALPKAICAVLVFVLIIFGFNRVFKYVPIFERLISLEQALDQEKYDSRLGKYSYIIAHTNPLVGNGVGALTNRSAKEIKAAESYFLKIYYEMGIFILVPFVLLLIASFLRACRFKAAGQREIIFLIFFSMIIVHAFDSPAFFIFWGIVMSSFRAEGKVFPQSSNHPVRISTI